MFTSKLYPDSYKPRIYFGQPQAGLEVPFGRGDGKHYAGGSTSRFGFFNQGQAEL